MKKLALLVVFASVLFAGCMDDGIKACTAEAKICPDGSAVGRTGPNCEFTPCPAIVGGDSDAHGCKASAGYSWCEASQKCIRAWEENCTVQRACTEEARICPDGSAVGRNGPNCEFAPCPAPLGGDRDAHGCLGSAGYSWCEAKQKCLRVWEEECSSGQASSVVEANNEFGFGLYRELAKDRSANLFFSPFSISDALAMTYEGARGKTQQEMQAVLKLPADDSARRSGYAAALAGINKADKKYQLSSANALWAQKDYTFLASYMGVVGSFYGGNATNMDFVGDSEGSRQTINSWVEDRTNDKIKDLIPAGALTPLTRLVLTNAIYFKGDWVRQFNVNDTKERVFRLPGGRSVKAQMMSLKGEDVKFPYAEDATMQAIELPYSGDDVSMIVLLPKGDDLEGLEKSMDQQRYEQIMSMLSGEKVEVHIPKFKLESKTYLAENLIRLGMPTAFTNDADFSGMTGKRDLKIDKVIHQAYVDVNEEGTEAAAATAVIMDRVMAVRPRPTKVFDADHPFMFLIVERQTGNILFMGRVSNPGGSQGQQEPQRHVCTAQEHAAEACTLEYNPVCGWFNDGIKCIRYPCAQTYGNGCGACADDKVEYWTRGECPAGDKPEGNNQLANPASVYCSQVGGSWSVKEMPEGQVGYCTLLDNRTCEEWALYRSNGTECVAPDGSHIQGGAPVKTISLEGKVIVAAKGTRSESWGIMVENGPAEYMGKAVNVESYTWLQTQGYSPGDSIVAQAIEVTAHTSGDCVSIMPYCIVANDLINISRG
ncbi:MAG: serpin family protein [Candidatus Altiarchaeota archaeon]